MSRRASDISAQVAKMTSSVVQVLALPGQQTTGTESPEPRRKSANPRFTVIMPKEQHRFIMQFALDLDSDASTITRNLFTMLQTDPALARQLREQIGGHGEGAGQ